MTLADDRRTLEQLLRVLPDPGADTVLRFAGTEGDMRQALASAIDALDHLQPLMARVADLEAQLARVRQDGITAGVDALRRCEERLEEYRAREARVQTFANWLHGERVDAYDDTEGARILDRVLEHLRDTVGSKVAP